MGMPACAILDVFADKTVAHVEFEFEFKGTATIDMNVPLLTVHPEQLITNGEKAMPLVVKRLHFPGEAAAANVIGTVKIVA